MFIEKRVEDTEELMRINNLINEAESLLEKGNAIESAEKLYEAAKASIILLAKKYGLKEVEEAEKLGGWNIELLEKAVSDLYKILGIEIVTLWDSSSFLHLAIEDNLIDEKAVKSRLLLVRKLVELTEHALNH